MHPHHSVLFVCVCVYARLQTAIIPSLLQLPERIVLMPYDRLTSVSHFSLVNVHLLENPNEILLVDDGMENLQNA